MNRNSSILLSTIIVLVLCCILPEISVADVPFANVNIYTATFLRFPRGTRAIALGGAGVADPATSMNIYYNPAIAFAIEDFHFVQGYHEWPIGIDMQDYGVYTGRSFTVGNDSRILVGGGIRYTHFRLDSSFEERTIFLPGGTGRTFDVKDYYLTLTTGGGISTRWIDAGIGFSAKPVNLGWSDEDNWFWTYDMGVLTSFNLPEAAGMRFIPTLGASFLNFNKDVDFADYVARLPYEFRIGAGLRIESRPSEAMERHLGIRGPVVAVSGTYDYADRDYANGKNGDSYGVEMTFLDAFSMRVGHTDRFISSAGTTYGMGFGWWFRTMRVQFDVANFPTSSFFADARENSYGVSIIADI
jgi:hypothetical protein